MSSSLLEGGKWTEVQGVARQRTGHRTASDIGHPLPELYAVPVGLTGTPQQQGTGFEQVSVPVSPFQLSSIPPNSSI